MTKCVDKDKIIMGLINFNSICRKLNLLTKSINANNYTCHEIDAFF